MWTKIGTKVEVGAEIRAQTQTAAEKGSEAGTEITCNGHAAQCADARAGASTGSNRQSQWHATLRQLELLITCNAHKADVRFTMHARHN